MFKNLKDFIKKNLNSYGIFCIKDLSSSKYVQFSVVALATIKGKIYLQRYQEQYDKILIDLRVFDNWFSIHVWGLDDRDVPCGPELWEACVDFTDLQVAFLSLESAFVALKAFLENKRETNYRSFVSPCLLENIKTDLVKISDYGDTVQAHDGRSYDGFHSFTKGCANVHIACGNDSLMFPKAVPRLEDVQARYLYSDLLDEGIEVPDSCKNLGDYIKFLATTTEDVQGIINEKFDDYLKDSLVAVILYVFIKDTRSHNRLSEKTYTKEYVCEITLDLRDEYGRHMIDLGYDEFEFIDDGDYFSFNARLNESIRKVIKSGEECL